MNIETMNDREEMTTYTVYSESGNVYDRGLCLESAMHEMITHDSHVYQIRSEDRFGFKWWELWVGRDRRSMRKVGLFSDCENEKDAINEIALEVIKHAGWSLGPIGHLPECCPDAEYDS